MELNSLEVPNTLVIWGGEQYKMQGCFFLIFNQFVFQDQASRRLSHKLSQLPGQVVLQQLLQ